MGTSFSVEEKASVFTTNLSMSKFLSVFNERNYILPKNLQLRLFFTNLFYKRRQLCHFSGVYIRACLCCTNRRRLVPGGRFSKIPVITGPVNLTGPLPGNFIGTERVFLEAPVNFRGTFRGR